MTVPNQVLTVAEDAALLARFDSDSVQKDAARTWPLVTCYDRPAMSRSAQQTGLQQHGLDRDDLERQGRCRLDPETSLEGGVASLRQAVTEEITAEQPIWAIFDWPNVGDMEAKLRQQEILSAFIASHPRLVSA